MTGPIKKSRNHNISLLLVLAVGFIGGILANLVVVAMNWVPEVSANHPLFGAPFLTFLGAVLVVIIFYHPLRTLLSRGALTIKWGDREISITEIEESVDTQFNELESKLANIVDDIEELKESSMKAEKVDKGKENQKAEKRSSILDEIKKIFPEVMSDDLASIIYHLGSTDYKWRNQATLSKRTTLNAETIDSIVLTAPNLFIRSRAKSGNTIYRLTAEAKGKLRQSTRI